jgi:hypothetical protein
VSLAEPVVRILPTYLQQCGLLVALGRALGQVRSAPLFDTDCGKRSLALPFMANLRCAGIGLSSLHFGDQSLAVV